MDAAEAKRLTLTELTRLGLPFTKLRGKTVGFTDLARGSCVFITVYGGKPDPKWGELESFARTNGFRVMLDGSF